MDFTPGLSMFQGVIMSADNEYFFSRFLARGGYEDQIDDIISSLHRFLEHQNFISQNAIVPEKAEELRKYVLYIILNADLTALEQLADYDGIDSVIWTVSTIPKCLMSEILWKLHLDKFIYEAIAFTCPELSLDLVAALLENIKYFKPSETIPKLRTLASALYKQICRLNFFNYENNLLTSTLTTALNYLQKCLNFFIEPPKIHLLESLKKDELYKYKGNTLETMLNLIYECLTEFTSIQIFNPTDFSEIYQLTYKVGSYKEDPLNFATCNTPNKSILECLDKCNEMLLDTLKVLVMDVSVDIFCAWSEFEVGNKSMQQGIGELCYKLRTKLLNMNVISEHPVVSMIQQISRKPVDVEDIISAADVDTIVKNIQNHDENHPKWVRALLQVDKLCYENNLIDLMDSNLNVLSEEDACNLYKQIRTYLDKQPQNSDKLKLLAVKAFKNCSADAKNELLDNHFKDKSFTDSMEISEFNNMMTEIFNKVIANSDADLTDILTVFLQNPENVYIKIFNLSAESSQAMNIMLKVMLLLQRFSNHYYNHDTEPALVRIAETVLEGYIEREVTQENFIKFMCGLKSENIIPGTKLLMLLIMPKLHKALLDKDVRRIHFQCKILSRAFDLEELVAYRAPMLAMMAQIMEVVRTPIKTFVDEAPSALQLAIDLQQKLMGTYGKRKISEKEESWLKSKLRKRDPLNCYYYRKLWNPPGENFVEIVFGKSITRNMDKSEIILRLSQILFTTTQQEWCEIWDSLQGFSDAEKLDVLCSVLSVLTVTEAANRDTDNSWHCVLHSYRNLVYIVRYKFFKEPLTDEQVMKAVEKITSITNLTEGDNAVTLSPIFIPLFTYIVTRKNDYTVDVKSILSENLTSNDFKTPVLKLFAS